MKIFCKDWFQCHSGELKRLDTGLLEHIHTIWALHSNNNIFPSVKLWQEWKFGLLSFQFLNFKCRCLEQFSFSYFLSNQIFANDPWIRCSYDDERQTVSVQGEGWPPAIVTAVILCFTIPCRGWERFGEGVRHGRRVWGLRAAQHKSGWITGSWRPALTPLSALWWKKSLLVVLATFYKLDQCCEPCINHLDMKTSCFYPFRMVSENGVLNQFRSVHGVSWLRPVREPSWLACFVLYELGEK